MPNSDKQNAPELLKFLFYFVEVKENHNPFSFEKLLNSDVS